MEFFSPFSLSVHGIIRKEAIVVLMNLSRLMAVKLEEPLSHVCGWVNSRITIEVTSLYS